MSLSVSILSVSETSFTGKVQTTGLVPMMHVWYLDGEEQGRVTTVKGEKGSSYFFRGLSPGTTYSVRVVVYAYNPWRELDRGTTSATTYKSSEPEIIRPDDWYWRSRVSSGTALSMPASEWNDFISRIEEFADYEDVSLSYSMISRALATRGEPMKASQANAVRLLIAELSPRISVPYSVSSGDPITAAFFNGLKNSLNSIS